MENLPQSSFTVSGSPAPPPPPTGTALRIAAGSTTGAAPSAWMPPFSADTDFTGGTASANKAVAEQFTATADRNGTITIQFTSITDQAQINGIELS